MLLAVGSMQDLKQGMISRRVNQILLIMLPVALLVDLWLNPGRYILVTAVALAAGIFIMYLVSWIGAADAKFLMLLMFTLAFASPLQMVWFVVVSFAVWQVFPTPNTIREADPAMLVLVVLIGFMDPFFTLWMLFLYFGLLKYHEIRITRLAGDEAKFFPFLPALLVTTLFHLVAPGSLYFF
jgi:hypothetical protein